MKILKEPLLHFLIIGASLFGLYAWINPNSLSSANHIDVDEASINLMVSQFKKTWSREPTATEVKSLIEDFVIEEIYYREALAMGIDKGDPVIRRRLRQKMEFFSDNMTEVIQPAEGELEKYLKTHAEKFTQDAVYSFEQIYISPDLPALPLEEKIETIQSHLIQGIEVAGDQTMLPVHFEQASELEINRTLGDGFASQLVDLPLNQWSPPLRSGLGIHFIKLSQRMPKTLPALLEIQSLVEREWRYDAQQKMKSSIREKLLAQYNITVANQRNSSPTTPQKQVQ